MVPGQILDLFHRMTVISIISVNEGRELVRKNELPVSGYPRIGGTAAHLIQRLRITFLQPGVQFRIQVAGPN